MKATIFNIARCSLHDGDGIRTVVYFKGCNLRCQWCHNPEGIAGGREILYHAGRCIKCGRCVTICPGHHQISGDEMAYIRQGCTKCGKCVAACPNEALSACGKQMTTGEVFGEISKDMHYFKASGGGVTFSGGECLLHPEFLLDLLVKCKEAGINTAVETAFHIPWGNIETVRNQVDTFIIDIKHCNGETHRQLTGVTNTLILDNINRISKCHQRIILRIPLIPGLNDDDGNLLGTARLINSFGAGIQMVELLKYNNMAGNKYAALGLDNIPKDDLPQEDGVMQQKGIRLKSALKDGIEVVC